MIDLTGKKILILGVANERSLAFAIAKKFKEQGATIGLTYLNEALKKRVAPIAEELKADFCIPFDCTKEGAYAQLQKDVKSSWSELDIIVHSIAYASRESLTQKYHSISQSDFLEAMNISVYSLVGVVDSLSPLLKSGSSIMTMSYQGSSKVIKNYNVMGVAKAALESSVRYLAYDLGERKIRVNAISAGPLKTLSSSAIAGFKTMLDTVEANSPLKENITTLDVAHTALYLASDLSSRVTGQILYVDSGFSIMGVS